MIRCVTDLALERDLLGELTGADRDHVVACDACQARLAAKRADGAAYMASPAARAFARSLAAAEPGAARLGPRRLWLAAAVVVTAAVALVAWPRASDPEAEVRAVERAWMQAYLDDDVAALDAILAPDYTFTDGAGGVTTKADDLRNARLHRIHFDAYETSDLQVRVWGDTAVVTGTSSLRGNVGGRPFAHHISFTDTLARIDGRWRAVAAHVSRARP